MKNRRSETVLPVLRTVAIFSIIFFPLIFVPELPAQIPGHPGTQSLKARQQAELLFAQRQFGEAAGAYEDLVKKNAKDPYLVRGFVRAFQGAGRMDEVEPFLKERLVESQPSPSSSLLYGLGYYQYLIGTDEGAGDYFKRAVEADPQNALAWNNWGAALARKKSYTDAVEKVRRAIRTDPSESMFFHNLKTIYADKGKDGLFIAEFEEYADSGPPELARGYGKVIARTFRQEGFSLYAQGRLDDAIGKFDEMLDVYQKIDYVNGLVPGLFSLGLLYEEKGDLEKSEKYFREVLAINPKHIQARKKLKGKQ
ncbi:MAG: tetratricopeptide repeat protein [Nitrospinaceae bacterium]